MSPAPQRLRIRVGQTSLILGPDDFIAAGGEGRVFAKGQRAFKIFHDPGKAPRLSKLAELGALQVPAAVLPAAPVFAPGRGCGANTGHAPIGYEMAWLDQSVSWGQSCTQAHTSRTGTRPHEILRQVESLRASLVQIHAQGCVVVDLSENNVVLAGSSVHLLDVDSWQTPTHGATALTPNVASPSCAPDRDGRYDVEQDWFAFAILSFTRLVGIHPFKGKHPRVRGLQARMAAGLSVLDPEVRTPAVCHRPQACIPAGLLDWYQHVFSGQKVAWPAPPSVRAMASPAAPSHNAASPGPSQLRLCCRTTSPILSTLVVGAHLHVATTHGVHDATGAQWLRSEHVLALGLTEDQEPFALLGPPHAPSVALRGSPPVPLLGPLDGVTQARGQLFVRYGGRVAALDVRALGTRAVPVLRDVARVLPRATRMFEGVLVQDLFGTVRVTVLGHSSGAPSFDVRPSAVGGAAPLRPNDVIDARADGDRVVLCSRSPLGAREDTVLLNRRGHVQSHTTTPDADGYGTTFAATATVWIDLEEDGLCVRSAPSPAADARRLPVPGPGTLSTDGSNIAYTTARAVYRVPAGWSLRGQRTPSP